MKREWEGVNGRHQSKLKVPGVMRCVKCGRALLHPLPTGEHVGRHCAKKSGLLPHRPLALKVRLFRMAKRRANAGQCDWVDQALGLCKEPCDQDNEGESE